MNARTSGRVGHLGKEIATMGYKSWMLVWAGVSAFAVFCIYAAAWN